jgi:acyl carrier protein
MSVKKVIIPAALLIPCGITAGEIPQDIETAKSSVVEKSKKFSEKEVREKVYLVISRLLGTPMEKISGKLSLQNDLGADSLDLVEMVLAMEKEFEITISDEAAEKITVVEQAVNTIIHSVVIVGKFSEGFAWVKSNNKYGFIDTTGKELVPYKYDDAGDFSGGIACVKSKDKELYIDKQGNEYATEEEALKAIKK